MTFDQFPDWMMPEDPMVDPPMSDYLALAEWYFAHVFEPDSWPEVRAIADERRTVAQQHGIDFASDQGKTAYFYGWHNGIKAMMNFLPSDCPDANHMLQHTVRGFQYSVTVLLLTLEPETPDPLIQETQ